MPTPIYQPLDTSLGLRQPGGFSSYSPSSQYDDEESRSRGLLGFMGSDFGDEIGPRLGVISQILMGLGSGRGPGDVAGTLSEINERSRIGRERRKAERMVGRLADKIEERDPEMADAMRSNLQFGMEMLGKQYSQKWETQGAIERSKAMLPYDIEKATKVAEAEGKVSQANKLAELTFKAEQDRKAGEQLMAMLTGRGGAADTATNGVQTPVTPPVTGQPTTQVPSSDVASLPPQPAPATGQPLPTLGPTEMPPLSPDPPVADLQRALMKRYPGMKVYATDAVALLTEARQGKTAEVHTILRAMQTRADTERENERQRAFTKSQADTAYQRIIDEPGLLETSFLAQERPEIAPTVSRTPLDKLAVLRSEGLSDKDIELMGGADVAYNQIIAGVRGGPDARSSAVTAMGDDLRKARADQKVVDKQAAAAAGIAASADAVAATIPKGKAASPDDLRDLAILDSAKKLAPVDPDKANEVLLGLSGERRLRMDALSQAQARNVTSQVALAEEARKTQDQQTAAAKLADQEKGKTIRALNNAVVVKRTVGKLAKIMYGKDERGNMAYGPRGWVEGLVPGTANAAAEGLIATIEGQIANGELQTIRNESVTGASGYGQLNKEELDLLKSKLVNLRTAVQSGVGLEEALKDVWNYYEGMIHPTSGERLDTEAQGFETRPFDFERDSPGLYYWAEREGKLGDYVREDKAPFNNEDPLGIGSRSGNNPADPLNLGPRGGG